MILFASVFSWISTILSIACVVWLLGLGVFVLVRSIILKVKSKKEMNEDLKVAKKQYRRKFGSDDDEY